jgi:hypothetical protein
MYYYSIIEDKFTEKINQDITEVLSRNPCCDLFMRTNNHEWQNYNVFITDIIAKLLQKTMI